MRHPRTPGRMRAASAALVPATLVLVAACGGASSKTTSATQAPAAATTTAPDSGGRNNAQLQAFQTCMASHSEPLPTFAARPRPTTTTAPAGAGATTVPDGGGRGAGGNGGRGFGGGFGGGLAGGNTFLRGLDANDPKVQAAYNACKAQIPAALLDAQQQRQGELAAFVSCMKDHGVTISTTPAAPGTPTTTIDRTSAAYKTCSILLPATGPGGAGGPGGVGGVGGNRGPTSTTTP